MPLGPDDRDVVDNAFDVEAAADPGKFAQGFADEFGRDVEIEGDGGGSGGVANIVNARRMQKAEHAEVVALKSQAEFAV